MSEAWQYDDAWEAWDDDEGDSVSDRLNEALELADSGVVTLPSTEHMWALNELYEAARAYADLVNGERVEPDYEAADDKATELGYVDIIWDDLLAIVEAAIGDRLLIDPPKEEE